MATDEKEKYFVMWVVYYLVTTTVVTALVYLIDERFAMPALVAVQVIMLWILFTKARAMKAQVND